ncbi:nuclear pore complex protein Nup88-like protein [Leptotrombidium deliense]|uniref:Nuclear pore complex protein Nup88-like protein n=1 Tax=Leptotrombidium deliense TaxID=299467 RepID=A0A443SVW8_9ACAR|nr:nuclear pore complex protein Nup88-like protein [Leptotrombidium deliense]
MRANAFCFSLEANKRTNAINHLFSIQSVPKAVNFNDVIINIWYRCWCLDERFFVCNQKILLLDASWHPASRDEKHIVLLTNDNCLRVYNINEPHIVHHEIKLSNCELIGKSPFSVFASSLGETAVSFDFGLPVPKSSYKCNEDEQPLTLTSSECLWPIYVLKGNGDVLVVYTNLQNTYLSERILGPLTMFPAAEDNYGLDACKLICLNSLPQIIVIATSSGMLYHCLALTDEQFDSDSSLLPQPTLFVHESIELTLSLTSQDEVLLCPIRLYKDPLGPERYFCSHSAGIHAISLPIVNRLSSKRFNLENIDQSVVEHLICTKPIYSACEANEFPLGMDIIIRKGQSHIKVFLSTGDIITQRLSLLLLNRNEKTDEQNAYETKPDPKVEFSDYISEILKRNTSAPLLKSSSDTVASQEKNLQLLLSTTEVFKQEYLSKMSVAAVAIERRVKHLISDKKLQFDELRKCENERESVLLAAQKLTDKYDSILERQHNLSSRLDQVLEILQSRQIEMSDAEIQMLKDLKNIKQKLLVYHSQVEKVKLKFKYQQDMENAENTSFSSSFAESDKHLPSKVQMKNISNIVTQE